MLDCYIKNRNFIEKLNYEMRHIQKIIQFPKMVFNV